MTRKVATRLGDATPQHRDTMHRGVRSMSDVGNATSTTAGRLWPGALVTRHPDHPDEIGRWIITAPARPNETDPMSHVALDYVTPDGQAGRFVILRMARVSAVPEPLARQQLAADLLAWLVEGGHRRSLPAATWTLGPDGALYGRIGDEGGELPKREVIRWADYLRSVDELKTITWAGSAQEVTFTTHLRGAQVTIWAKTQHEGLGT